ncbi:MAG TPA: YukJ family protein, partial [Candidatus Tectomicrobia bacterium]
MKIVDNLTEYRAAINVMSQDKPSEVLYLLAEPYDHPVLAGLQELTPGFHPLPSQPGSHALDFVRGNLFVPTHMRPLPFNVPGTDNDLNEKLDRIVQQALADEETLVYVFGERWGPEPQTRDKIFGFLPGNGVHDVHMNQGNVGRWVQDDG